MTALEHVITVARTVRTDLLGRDDVPRNLAGECGLAAMRVAAAIGDPRTLRVGFFMKHEWFCGLYGRYPNNHAWCQIGDTIIDPTATQFGRHHRAVHVVKVGEDNRYIETADSADAIDVIMTDWRGRKIAEYKQLAKSLRRRCA